MPRRVVRCLAVLALALGGAVAPALGAPGDLDAGFGAAGVARVDLGASEETGGVALQPDGRVVVAGRREGPGVGDVVVARLLSPLGSLDPGYAGGFGWSLLDFGTTSDAAGDVALQPDGRILVVGQTAGDIVVSRLLNPEGTFDGSFGGGDGREVVNLSITEFGNAIALRPDGRIVVAGWGAFGMGIPDMTVAQLTAAGPLDTSYAGGSGWSQLDFNGDQDFATAVAIQPDGRIVAGGVTRFGTNSRFAIARLVNPAGTFDPSFGPAAGGRITVELGAPSEAADLVIRPDGTIVAAGTVGSGASSDVALVGLRANGTLDPGFAGDGSLVLPEPGLQLANAMALQPDGKIVVAGRTGAVGQPADILVLRLQPNGQLDSTFGTGGRTVVNLGGDDVAQAIALQPDGRIAVAGDTNAGGNADIVVLRLQGDPAGAAGGGPGAGGAGPAAGRPRCAGKLATIIGTARRDVLRGTPRADVIAALGGDDVVRGLGGADRVCGGAGRDRLEGGPGPDRLLGGPGPDRLLGGPGPDRLLGGAGRDILTGGGGPDRLAGGLGVDVLRGGPGVDVTRQ